MKLLLVPGSGATAEFWFQQTARLPAAEGVDLPGHPVGKPCPGVEGYVEWLRGYIRGRGLKDVVLGGHSLGGAVALRYALNYPEELRGLVLIGSGARLRVHPSHLERLRQGVSDPEAWARESLEPSLQAYPPELRPAVRGKRLAMGAGVALHDMLCCDRFDVMGRVSELKLPTLIINGSEDVMTFVKYARYLHEGIAGSRLVIIEGAGHYVAMQQPDKVNQALAEFLLGLPASVHHLQV